MLGIVKLKFKIETGDEVYLKNTFKKYFNESTGLLFVKEMDRFQGQRVRITMIVLTYHDKGQSYSFVAKRINGSGECQRFPLICIDRSQPLIRNGKRYSLKNKDIYISVVR
jgi:hypothetical protein